MTGLWSALLLAVTAGVAFGWRRIGPAPLVEPDRMWPVPPIPSVVRHTTAKTAAGVSAAGLFREGAGPVDQALIVPPDRADFGCARLAAPCGSPRRPERHLPTQPVQPHPDGDLT